MSRVTLNLLYRWFYPPQSRTVKDISLEGVRFGNLGIEVNILR